MPRILRFPLALSAVLLAFLAGGASAAPPGLADLTPAMRTRIDRLARQQPLDTLCQEKVIAASDVSLWMLSHLSLAPQDEAEHVKELDKQIRRHNKVIATPPAADKVFRKLLEPLPPHLKPEAFDCQLIVLDLPEPIAFTCGGGKVHVSRLLLDALPADKPAGANALAFILAHELGHIGLKHCRRGWQAFEIQEEIKKGIDMHVARARLRDALETGVEVAGDRTTFLYTRKQLYDADVFAYQLCQNAGLPVDQALDGLRWLALTESPAIRTDANFRPDHTEALRDPLRPPPALLRLRRMLMERDGLVEDEANYGLFAYDGTDTLHRCERQSIGAGEKPIVFVHGLRGSENSFRDYLRAFGERPELRGRKLLVFRYPNNESLARCGLFLHREMVRVGVPQAKTFFVCHSAGGLVFRSYAEVLKGGFDRAVLLTTPNEGSNLTTLKFLLDVSSLAGEMRLGGPGAFARMVPEGHGQIVYDVHPDSLFLRRLGHNAALAKRYHVFSGECLDRLQVLAFRTGLVAIKRVMTERMLPKIRSDVLRHQAQRRIDELRVPSEITRGDLVVSVRSALLKDAGRATRTALNHHAFLHDEQVIRQVGESIVEK